MSNKVNSILDQKKATTKSPDDNRYVRLDFKSIQQQQKTGIHLRLIVSL